METIIRQSADGLILIRDNDFNTKLGKVFINNHEITDIDTFFKVAEENTRLLEQCKKQKEAINKVIKALEIQIEVIKEQPSDNDVSDNFEINQRNMCIKLLKEVSE